MITSKRLQWLGVSLAFGILFTCFASSVQAIPAFARKYRTSCATCHEAFPRLNAVGEAFRLNGYKFVDDSAYIKQEPVELGDEAYKRVWPKALWPSDIPGGPPIAIRGVFDYDVDLSGAQESSNTFQYPDEVELFAAGSMGDDMSFFMEMSVEEGEVETAGWLQIEDLFGAENLFNVKIGTIGMNSFGTVTSRDQNRLTNTHYLYGDWSLPYPEGFEASNQYRLNSEPAGIELNGFGAHWQYALGVVQGDEDISEKDYFFQFAYKIGGATYDGSDIESETLSSPEFWRDNNFTMSLFAYRGTSSVNYMGDESTDNFWRVGPGVSWKNGDCRVAATYIFGRNDNPYGVLTSDSVDSDSWLFEGEYFIYPWLIPSVRYESLTLDLPDIAGFQNQQDMARVVASTKFVLRANVTFTVEAVVATKNDSYEKAIPALNKNLDDRLYFRFDFAF